MATQINSFNGGPVLPGDTLKLEDLKSLLLRHTRPNGEQSVEEYSPLEEKTVDFNNITFTQGGETVGTYDPLASGPLEVELGGGGSDSVLVKHLYLSSDFMPDAIFEELQTAIDNDKFVVVANHTGSQSHVTYWGLVSYGSTGMVFARLSDGHYHIMTVALFGDDNGHAIAMTDLPIGGGSGGDYIHKYSAPAGWLGTDLSNMGFIVGSNVLGVLCSQGNNANYQAYIDEADVSTTDCLGCGFIIALDERTKALESDECRNVSVDVTLKLSTPVSQFWTEDAARAALPNSIWLRVVRFYTGDHGVLSPARSRIDGVWVNLDQLYCDVAVNQDTGTNSYVASINTKFQIAVIGDTWTFVYKGNG